MNQYKDLDLKYIYEDFLPYNFAGYELRPEQLEMAYKIEEALNNGKHMIVEAGTGVGKSLAYLIPIIIHSIKTELPVLVSTYTKTLQKQLAEKDLPTLQELLGKLGIPFSYHIFFGSENYLCLRRFYNAFGELLSSKEILNKLREYFETTGSHDGLLLDLPYDLPFDLLDEINRDPDLCLYKNCMFFEKCFYYNAFKKIRMSNVVVVNHHLLLMNVVLGGRILPKSEVVVLDEAHNIEDVAFELFGSEVTEFKIKKLIGEIYNPYKNRGIILKLKNLPYDIFQQINEIIKKIKDETESFFDALTKFFPKQKDVIRIYEKININTNLIHYLHELAKLLNILTNHASTYEENVEIKVRARRLIEIATELELWLDKEDKNFVYWMELTRKKKIIIKKTPLEIASILREQMFETIPTVILTSATIAVNSNFSYFKHTLGIDDAIELLLGSPFDYKNRVILYTVKWEINPRENEINFLEACEKEIKKILKITKGATFILLTSYKIMDYLYDAISTTKKIKTLLNLLKQGQSSRYKLLTDFKHTEHSVLFGTSTFWQGVDVPGEALICVIIPKLPFDVPDHPVIEARQEYIKSMGEDPFKDFSLPRAILRLKQGFGRLMRSKTDWGIVAILDPRIYTKWYGRFFLKALPECRILYEFSELKSFFKLMSTKE